MSRWVKDSGFKPSHLPPELQKVWQKRQPVQAPCEGQGMPLHALHGGPGRGVLQGMRHGMPCAMPHERQGIIEGKRRIAM